MKAARLVILSLLIMSGFVIKGRSQVFIGTTEIDTSTVVTGLDTPWEILWGPDDHIWLTERYGRISRLDPETGELTVLLTIPEVIENNESGLLGMVLHPDFSNHPYVYVAYTYEASGIWEKLVRYTYSQGTLGSPFIMLDGITGSTNHDGARLLIDENHKLFMTTGDARNTSASQDINSLSGKVLRMNLDGSVPADNPFPGNYVWTWGHRNAQGLVISPLGIMYSSEHGPSSDDEVNIIEKGRNYGWPEVMGFCSEPGELQFCADSNVMEPIRVWTPTLAVAGTDYYHHPAIPEWQNTLLVTSLKASQLTALSLSADGRSVTAEEMYFQFWFGRLRDLCISPDGRVFLAVSNRDGRGNVRPGDDRIVEITALQNTEYCVQQQMVYICEGYTYDFMGREISQPGIYLDTIVNAGACDTIVSLHLDYYDSGSIVLEDSVFADINETVSLTANEGFLSYKWNDDPVLNDNVLTFEASEPGAGTYYYTIEVETEQGCILRDTVIVVISGTVNILSSPYAEVSVYPNPVSGNVVQLHYKLETEAQLRIYTMDGKEVSGSILSPGSKEIKVQLPEAGGLYNLLITGSEGNRLIKVLKL